MYKIKNIIFCIHIIITNDHEEIIRNNNTEEDYNDIRRSKKPNDS